MTLAPRDDPGWRVLVLTPTGRDAALTQAILGKADIAAFICRDADSLCRETLAGVGCVLIAEEALRPATQRALVEVLSGEPAWSDLPMLVLARAGAESTLASSALASLGNTTLLDRPLRVPTLVSAVRAALRARARQYELRDRLEAQSLLAAIVSSSEDAIVSKTRDDIILTWNRGAERIFGYSAAEAIGQPITLIVPDSRREEEKDILRRILRGERLEHFETKRVAKDGSLLDVSLTISPLRDAEDRIIGVSKVARDVTPQKLAEQALRDADRRKDEFLATLAHELRNPLAPILNSLHIMRLAANDDPAIERVRGIMERQVNHMVRLVDDLMEVSRITRGKIELRREPVELAAVLKSAIETSQPLIESARHRLSVTLPPEPVVLDADPVRLAQVFSNLLNNSAKYSEEKGQIWVTVVREPHTAVVSVRDAGIGLAKAMLPRVFDMFTQIDSAGGRSRGGLGIGLTLVKNLVRMHGGQVTAASEGPGKGCEFTVRLPLSSRTLVDAPTIQGQSTAGVPLRVLVVDDNLDSAESLGVLLRLVGAESYVVHDGASALRALGMFRPDLVLLDIGMPDMDGYEVARRIRQLPEYRDLVLIALTGWGQEQDRRRSAAAGFDHHLLKPTDMVALQALMATLRSQGERRAS